MSTPTLTKFETTAQLTLTELQVDARAGEFSGTATRYDHLVDRGFGIWLEIAPGAFAAQAKDPARVKVLWQHERSTPIGRLSQMTDRTGPARLDIVGKVIDSPHVPKAAEALALMREGIVDELSVGFQWLKWERREEGDGDERRIIYRVLKALLLEVSPVTFGAMGQDAAVRDVHQQAPSARAAAAEVARIRARMLAASH